MATYKGIKGVKVQSKAADPTASEAEGTVWYNTATTALKYVTEGAGTWASENAMATARNQSAQATQATVPAQGLVAGGGATTAPTAVVEEFDGTNWSEKNNLTTARRLLMGAGTTTAMIGFGGLPNIQKTEKWDGTSWTEVNDLLTGREYFGGAGTSTAALAVGNGPYPVPTGKYTEEYDGTSWTEVNDINTQRSGLAACGLQTAAMAMGGYSGSPSVLTEIYDGTSWSEGSGDLNSGRDNAAGSGSTTAALCYSYGTEIWDGTSWATGANLATQRNYFQGMGSTSQGSGAALAAGGYDAEGNQVGTTESWENPVYTIKTVTVS